MKKSTIFLILALFVITGVKAQLIVSDNEGCVGDGFTFEYQNGSSLTNITWDFGDGSGSQDLLTVQHSYSQSGTFTIVFSADGVNETAQITIHANPVAGFTGSGDGCVPADVVFINTSTGGDGSAIVSSNWVFGDGGSGTTGEHTYQNAGVYSVSLSVTDANGCFATITQDDVVAVSEKPHVEITPSEVVACTAPLDVTFSGSACYSNSPNGTSLTYLWNFGNSNTGSGVAPPIQTYDTAGIYTVTLEVTDNNNCINYDTITVSITNPIAGFIAPDTVCKEVTFVDTSKFADRIFWNYGDNPGYTTSNEHTYQDTGHYTVTQIVFITGTACSDTIEHEVFVEEPTAIIDVDPSFLCETNPPGNIIHFSSTNSYENIDSTFWFFSLDTVHPAYNVGHYHANMIESTDSTPNLEITFIGNEYSINSFVVYGACLTVQTIHGCRNDTCIIDTIQKPNALFMTDKHEGCLPLTVQFSDSSTSFSNIISYEWVFGDGNSFSGGPGDDVCTHTYTNAGVYNAYLIITCERGCVDTSYMQTIYVGDVTNPAFSISQTNVCPNEEVIFTDASSPADSIDAWHYTADNGIMSHCSGDNSPTWNFHSKTGTYDITLTTCHNGCCTSTTVADAITVKGPICKIDKYYMECNAPYDYTFDAHLDDADSWQWDFGDGTILSGLTNPDDTIVNHTYTNTGDYNVVLTAYNSGNSCSPYTDTLKVYVRDIKAKITVPDTNLCIHNGYYFLGNLSEDVYKTKNRGYYWEFGDNTPGQRTHIDSIQHTYTDTGVYELRLIVRDINMCTDTDYINIYTYGVYAGFVVDSLYGCKPEFGVNFTDTSLCDYGDSIYHWYWDFGDNTAIDTTKNPHHDFVYDDYHSYRIVKMIVTDSIGCKDSLTKRITFSIPDPRFMYFPDNKICVGDTVGFNPYTNDSVGYTWDFGDNDTNYIVDANMNFYHIYNTDSIYRVHLQVSDSLGCKEDTVMNFTISVQSYPEAGFFTAPGIQPLCFGNSATFTDTSISKYEYQRHWTLEGNTPINPDSTVTWFYDQRGDYNIELIATTSNGCSDTAFGEANIIGPEADFSLNPELICKGQDITFSINNLIDVDYYFFDFGDGIITDTIDVNGQSAISETHTYHYGPESGQTIAQLTIFSTDTLCPVRMDTVVYIHTVIARFNRNNEISKQDTAHCLNIEDYFDSTPSINADDISWNFGDGTTAGNITNPSHMYSQAGIYNVQLAIYDEESQCVDTLIKQMIIFPNPDINATGGNICLGDSLKIRINGTGLDGVNFSWYPNEYIDNPNANEPNVYPEQTTDYKVVVVDTNNCNDSTTVNIFVQQPPEEWIRDTTIIIGETVNLNGEQAGGYTYVWSPETKLTCTICPNPVAQPEDDITYYLEVTDTMDCGFVANNQYNIIVLPESSVDVPDAFTPNGDGDNDKIYVRGWGIKRLIEFSIYNRWGERVYTSSDINEGWDGTFNGKPQNIDTYAYFVKVETYVDEKPITKKGTFVLIR